jgi:hypothetical protein
MTAKQYADKLFGNYPTYHKIASDAYKAGIKNAKPDNVKKLEHDLKKANDELKSLWQTLEDPEKCGELLGGM